MSSSCPVRVLLVDDHAVVLGGLRHMLEATGEFVVVGQAGDGIEAVAAAEQLKPDVVVMDVRMPRKDGVEACREIMDLLPDTRVLMLTASSDEDAVVEAVAAGATGYLQKFSGEEEFARSLRDVAAGQLRLPTTTVRRVFESIRNDFSGGSGPGAGPLSRRECQYLTLFSQGMSYAEIGESKGSSPLTVRNTLYRVQEKLGVRTKQEMVVWAVRNGLLDDMEVE